MKKLITFVSIIFVMLATGFYLTDTKDITVVTFLLNLFLMVVYFALAIGLYWIAIFTVNKIEKFRFIILILCTAFIITRPIIDRMVLSYVFFACIVLGLIHGLISILYQDRMGKPIDMPRTIWTQVSNYSMILSIAFAMTFIESLLRRIYPQFYVDFFNVLTILIIYNVVICSLFLLKRKKHIYSINT